MTAYKQTKNVYTNICSLSYIATGQPTRPLGGCPAEACPAPVPPAARPASPRTRARLCCYPCRISKKTMRTKPHCFFEPCKAMSDSICYANLRLLLTAQPCACRSYIVCSAPPKGARGLWVLCCVLCGVGGRPFFQRAARLRARGLRLRRGFASPGAKWLIHEKNFLIKNFFVSLS